MAVLRPELVTQVAAAAAAAPQILRPAADPDRRARWIHTDSPEKRGEPTRSPFFDFSSGLLATPGCAMPISDTASDPAGAPTRSAKSFHVGRTRPEVPPRFRCATSNKGCPMVEAGNLSPTATRGGVPRSRASAHCFALTVRASGEA